MWPFLCDFFLQTHQKRVYAVFLKVIDEPQIPWVLYNREAKTFMAYIWVFGHFGRLSSGAVNSADCWFDSWVLWWIHVMDMLSIVIFISTQKILFVLRKHLQAVLWIINLWANVAVILHKAFSWNKVKNTAFVHLQNVSHHLTQPQFTIFQSDFLVFYVFWDNVLGRLK